MAIIASISSGPATKREAALRAMPKVITRLKRVSPSADAEEVIAAVVEVLRIEMDAPAKKAKAKKD